MILYFSGTGNSRYAAEKISERIGTPLFCINSSIKREEKKLIFAEDSVVVSPTYAWRLPVILSEWIVNQQWKKGQKIWFVMTCGSDIGNAQSYNLRLCEQIQLQYMGTLQLIMPENYIAMFPVPNQTEAEQIVSQASLTIQNASDRILKRQSFSEQPITFFDRLKSGVVNPWFYRLCVKADAFFSKNSCIHCRKCLELCPLNNISLKDGHPIWSHRCTHCMACIAHCPTKAIEYGQKSIGKPRYHLD